MVLRPSKLHGTKVIFADFLTTGFSIRFLNKELEKYVTNADKDTSSVVALPDVYFYPQIALWNKNSMTSACDRTPECDDGKDGLLLAERVCLIYEMNVHVGFF